MSKGLKSESQIVQRRLLQWNSNEQGRSFIFFSNSVLIVSLAWGLLNQREVDAALLVARRILQKQGILVQFRTFFFENVQKPIGSRMGKGKGMNSRGYVYPVAPGDVVFGFWSELGSKFLVSVAEAAMEKLSVSCRIVSL